MVFVAQVEAHEQRDVVVVDALELSPWVRVAGDESGALVEGVGGGHESCTLEVDGVVTELVCGVDQLLQDGPADAALSGILGGETSSQGGSHDSASH